MCKVKGGHLVEPIHRLTHLRPLGSSGDTPHFALLCPLATHPPTQPSHSDLPYGARTDANRREKTCTDVYRRQRIRVSWLHSLLLQARIVPQVYLKLMLGSTLGPYSSFIFGVKDCFPSLRWISSTVDKPEGGRSIWFLLLTFGSGFFKTNWKQRVFNVEGFRVYALT